MKGRWIVFTLLVVTLLFPTHADVIISNTKDWKTVYLLGIYAPKAGYSFIALDSRDNAEEVVPYRVNKGERVIIYEGKDPVYPNYEGFLRGKGITNVTTVSVSSPYDIMFSLPADLGVDVRGAVIVNDSAGEWALMAGPLAYATDSIVLFLNNSTLEDVLSYVKNRGFDTVYVIGYAGKRLRDELPNAVFVSTGNKARDSVEVAKIFKKYVDYEQVLVMSGMFLYVPISDMPVWTGSGGRYPILISYVNKVPDDVKAFLVSDEVKSAVFIGPELDSVWSQTRAELGETKRIMNLFAIGYAGIPTRETGKMYPLPVLFLPAADLNVYASDVVLLSEGRVFLTVVNDGEAGGYFLPTLISINCDGEGAEVLPKDPVFIGAKDSAVVEYNTGTVLPQKPCHVRVEGIYGPDADRMEEEFNGEFTVMPRAPQDESAVEALSAKYSPRLERLIVVVRNTGPVDAWVTVYVKDILIDGVPTTLKSAPTLVRAGEEKKIYIRTFLTDADYLDNPTVSLLLRYGESKDLPLKSSTVELTLEKETLTDVVIEFIVENAVLVAAVALIIIVLLILRRR